MTLDAETAAQGLTVAARPAPVPASVFRLVVVITLAVIVWGAAFRPSDAVAAACALLVIAVLGLPHGSLDHAVAAVTGAPLSPPVDGFQQRFHAAYLAAIAGYAVVWLVAPLVALIAFLVVSIHHFGQSDLAHLRLRAVDQAMLQLSRGLLVVALPLVVHLDAVAPIVVRMTERNPEAWPLLADHTTRWAAAIVIQHAVVLSVTVWRSTVSAALRREAVAAVVLTPLLVAAPPLLGFAVYFGLWHSLNHLFVLRHVLARPPAVERLPLSGLVRIAAPRSVIALVALAVLSAAAVATGRVDLVIPLALVLVSVLTLPHMVVVERLSRARRA